MTGGTGGLGWDSQREIGGSGGRKGCEGGRLGKVRCGRSWSRSRCISGSSSVRFRLIRNADDRLRNSDATMARAIEVSAFPWLA